MSVSRASGNVVRLTMSLMLNLYKMSRPSYRISWSTAPSRGLKVTLNRHFCHWIKFESEMAKLGPSGCRTVKGLTSLRTPPGISSGTYSDVRQ